MQTHYFELRAIPQIEMTEMMVMNQLMQSLHRMLINYQGKIAISFPCYTQRQTKTLGGIIRLFGEQQQLVALKHELSQQGAIYNYAIILDINPVPTKISRYVSVSRVRTKGQSALRRSEKRLSEQGKWTLDVQNKMVEKWGGVDLKYPHCHLMSSSTGQRFILWVKQQWYEQPRSGTFNSYGMSQTATVPDF